MCSQELGGCGTLGCDRRGRRVSADGGPDRFQVPPERLEQLREQVRGELDILHRRRARYEPPLPVPTSTAPTQEELRQLRGEGVRGFLGSVLYLLPGALLFGGVATWMFLLFTDQLPEPVLVAGVVFFVLYALWTKLRSWQGDD